MVTDRQKIDDLSALCGLSDLDMAEQATNEGTAPSICMNDGCDFFTDMEPDQDQDQGYCENCNTNTVKSILVLLGMI